MRTKIYFEYVIDTEKYEDNIFRITVVRNDRKIGTQTEIPIDLDGKSIFDIVFEDAKESIMEEIKKAH